MHRTRYCNNTITALYIRRLDNLCVVLEVIVIIKIIISSGEKRKKASMHASNQVLQQHDNCAVYTTLG